MRTTWPVLAAFALLGTSQAKADGATTTIHLDTVSANKDVHWVVAEVRGGLTVSSRPVYGITTYGNVPALSIPFADNDGYWVARATFKLPENAVNPTLSIATLGVDDRAVVRMNGQLLTSAGTLTGGPGFMTFEDAGPNLPHYFPFASGPENIVVTTGFRTGFNAVQVIVNNTGDGIHGKPFGAGPTPQFSNSFGMTGTVTYTVPAR